MHIFIQKYHLYQNFFVTLHKLIISYQEMLSQILLSILPPGQGSHRLSSWIGNSCDPIPPGIRTAVIDVWRGLHRAPQEEKMYT